MTHPETTTDTALAISTHNLSKSFHHHVVLQDLNLAVPTGSVYGFIGANGAGKTTTIRILLGLSAATAGSARILGVSRGTLPPQPTAGVAYLPDVPALNPWMTARETLIFLGQISGVPADLAADRASGLLELVGLKNAHNKIGGFSRGMKQRLGIASTLIGAPQLIILDEPTSALDPLGRADVLALIRDLRDHATVFFSSHLLGDVQQVCTHVGILDSGRLLAQGSLPELLDRFTPPTSTLQLRAPSEIVGEAEHVIMAALKDAGIHTVQCQRLSADLQHLYTHLTQGERTSA